MYTTFHEAAVARGLAENDEEYILCLEESAVTGSAKMLRRLFAALLVHVPILNVPTLFDRFAKVFLKILDIFKDYFQ